VIEEKVLQLYGDKVRNEKGEEVFKVDLYE